MFASRSGRVARWGMAIALWGGYAAGSELHISEAEAKHSAVSKPAPVLSPMARNLKISGRVEVLVSIDASGGVTDVKATQGPPVLAMSVVDAVKKWKFTAFTDPAGTASAATTTLTFDFKQ